jgi:hypothetical protein
MTPNRWRVSALVAMATSLAFPAAAVARTDGGTDVGDTGRSATTTTGTSVPRKRAQVRHAIADQQETDDCSTPTTTSTTVPDTTVPESTTTTTTTTTTPPSTTDPDEPCETTTTTTSTTTTTTTPRTTTTVPRTTTTVPRTTTTTTATRPPTTVDRPTTTTSPSTGPGTTTTTTTPATPPQTTLPTDSPEVDLPPEVDRNGRSGDDGHSAINYDGIYAEGVPIGIAMAASRYLESRGVYTARAAGSSASGAYQVIDSTWNNFGGYPRAYLAPPAVQDQFAYESFVAILKRYGNDVSKIPVAWYYPAAISNPALMDIVPLPEAGNSLTPREYQTLWMRKFYELLGEGGPPFLPANDLSQPYIRSIAFPVLGPTWFMNDWGFPRGEHGERRHEGNDLMLESGQPLRAVVDGTVTRIRYTNEDTAGVVISITDADGYRYNYFHVNNDTPGTTDDAAPAGLRIHPALQVGTVVQAGQVIAYGGDTGNAVGVPHLHFEIRDRAGNPMNPYPSLLAAQQREQCSVGIGPWSTAFSRAERVQPAARLRSGGSAYTVIGPDGATWEITTTGAVRASGMGAVIAPPTGEDCPVEPTGVYGTGAKGLPLSLLPADWWEVMRGALLGSRLDVPVADARTSDRPGSI